MTISIPARILKATVNLDSSNIRYVQQCPDLWDAPFFLHNHVTHKCPIDSCKVDDKAWSDATFKNCDRLNKQKEIIPGHPLAVVLPLQYHVKKDGIDVQDHKTRGWYRCTKAQDKSNDHKSSEHLSAS
ncbi:hypothetical protein MJO28_006039 [Puccinia striiformis f. sp. tritici]|uniref:Uncharacterized protein n=1 Tax=Puccinia striiformis f. sp. tritici TaxID=168172 RepID=A0ACC0EFT9_9BASI|nr:hypothetical protein MJO28_006039 [Puccinia striiformis f. sp. tritici]